MKESVYSFSLNLQNYNEWVSVPIPQNDNSRTLYITVLDGSKPYEFTKDCIVVARVDGVDEHPCVIQDNVVVLNVPKEFVKNTGTVNCVLDIYGSDGSRLVTLGSFELKVVNTGFPGTATGTPEGQGFYNQLSQNIKDLNEAADKAISNATQATTDANNAASVANAKAGEAESQAKHAKDQGDYAKVQGDYADSAAGKADDAVEFINGEFDTIVQYMDNVAYPTIDDAITQAGYAKKQGDAAKSAAANANSAADNIEEKIGEKFNIVAEKTGRNVLDKTKFESGWLTEGGTLEIYSDFVTSDYIPITENLAYLLCSWNGTKVSYARPRKVCLYDEKKVFISGTYMEGTSLPHEGTIHGASYIRISFGGSLTDSIMLLLGDTTTDGITGYIPYGVTRYYKIPNNVVLRPKFKVVAAGDSITYGSKQAGDGYADMTEGVSYMTMACEHLGFELENHSISASTLSLASDGTNPHQAFIERYAGMSDDADLVYIAMGTNDWYYQFELGEMTDRTKTTFYGALHLLCQGLKDKYPITPIVFATPIKRYIIRSGEPAGNLNLKLQELDLWRMAIKEVCEYHSIPVVDMYAESFLNAWEESERTKYLPDGTHPNEAGHKKMQITCEAVLNKYLGDYYI